MSYTYGNDLKKSVLESIDCIPNPNEKEEIGLYILVLEEEAIVRETIIGALGKVMVAEDKKTDNLAHLLDKANKEIQRLRSVPCYRCQREGKS